MRSVPVETVARFARCFHSQSLLSQVCPSGWFGCRSSIISLHLCLFDYLVDEVNAIVVDIGTYQVKAGYAGEDAPKFSCPTSLGVAGQGPPSKGSKDAMDIDSRQFKAGLGSLETARDGMDVVTPFKDGLLDDWEAVTALCDHIFKYVGCCMSVVSICLTD